MAPFDTAEDILVTLTPDTEVSAREPFGVDFDMKVPGFTTRDPHVPDLDHAEADVEDAVEGRRGGREPTLQDRAPRIPARPLHHIRRGPLERRFSLAEHVQVLAVTHAPQVAARCHRVLRIVDGRVSESLGADR